MDATEVQLGMGSVDVIYRLHHLRLLYLLCAHATCHASTHGAQRHCITASRAWEIHRRVL